MAKAHGLNVSSVHRHRIKHLGALLKAVPSGGHPLNQHAQSVRGASAAIQAEQASYTAGIAADVGALRVKCLELGLKAEQSKDYRTALMAVRELTRLVELLHRVQVDDRRDAQDVASHPAWQRLQQALLGALGPFPEARGAVLIAIQNALTSRIPADPGGTRALHGEGGGADPPP